MFTDQEKIFNSDFLTGQVSRCISRPVYYYKIGMVKTAGGKLTMWDLKFFF